MPIHAPQPASTEAGLDRLLALEEELGERLRSARTEADRLRSEAESAVAAGRAAREAVDSAEAAVVARALSAERGAELDRLRREAVERVARIGALEDARVETLARRVLTRLLESEQGATTR